MNALLRDLANAMMVTVIKYHSVGGCVVTVFFIDVYATLPFYLLFSSLNLSPMFTFVSSLFPMLFKVKVGIVCTGGVFGFPVNCFLEGMMVELLIIAFLDLLLPLLLCIALFRGDCQLMTILFLKVPCITFVVCLLKLANGRGGRLCRHFFRGEGV